MTFDILLNSQICFIFINNRLNQLFKWIINKIIFRDIAEISIQQKSHLHRQLFSTKTQYTKLKEYFYKATKISEFCG